MNRNTRGATPLDRVFLFTRMRVSVHATKSRNIRLERVSAQVSAPPKPSPLQGKGRARRLGRRPTRATTYHEPKTAPGKKGNNARESKPNFSGRF